jgi:tetratricopeptide (TPR) repeat protein
MRGLFLLFVFTFFAITAEAQSVYDSQHSNEFATYLFKSQQYELAAIEFERLLFLKPQNDTLQVALVKSYAFNSEYKTALSRLNKFANNPAELPENLSDLYAYNLLADKQFITALAYLNQNRSLSNERVLYYRSYSNLFQKQYSHVITELDSIQPIPESLSILKNFAEAGQTLPRKSPFIAGALSTLIPGAGKFYTSDWKDGIISLVMVSAVAYQTYRGFHRGGISSPYGWIYGTVAVGFYFGNIYGSVKSAQRFNKRKAEKLEKRIEESYFLRP